MGSRFRVLASLLLIGAFVTTPQMSAQTASQAIVDDGVDGMARATNRMTGGIISYARWPDGQRTAARTLCVVGTPRLTERIAPIIPGGPAVTVRRMSAAAATSGSDCDIVFLGRMPVADRQRLIGWMRGRPVLTITDDDPACHFGAMFCLSSRHAGIGFSVNLDAISRGPLRIDPRVLKIGQGEEAAP